jgi:post-segregation antitoxin (ccd killing protein)
MSRKINYGFDTSGAQRFFDSMSPLIQATQMSHAVLDAMPTNHINQQLLEATQPMREAVERMNRIFNSSGMVSMLETTNKRISETMSSFKMIENSNAIQNALQSVSLHSSVMNSFKDLNLGIDLNILKTMQGLTINISGVEAAIQNNLRLFKEIDWTEIIEPEDLEEFDIENTLDGVIVDINDGISLQQRVMVFVDKLKSKYPLIFMIFMMFVCSPIQSAIDDAVLGAIKGTTIPIIEQAKTTDYKVIKKNIKIEVNNTLNINIESKDVRDELLKVYGYVSTDSLIMRQSNKVRSRAVHTLKFGQVIKIIHKDRNWTLVEYESDEDVIRGWVFTRYISKFKK